MLLALPVPHHLLPVSCRWAGYLNNRPVNRTDKIQAWPVELSGVQAFRHMLHAPIWMKNLQLQGTPARLALWEGNSSPPLLKTLSTMLAQDNMAARSANFTRVLEFFVPRYQAWKADPSKAITDADVLELMRTLFRGDMGPGEGAETQAPRVQPATCEAGICPAITSTTDCCPEVFLCCLRACVCGNTPSDELCVKPAAA